MSNTEVGTVTRLFDTLTDFGVPDRHRRGPRKRAPRLTHVINGKPVEFVQIGEVAKAIGCSTGTIRRWEKAVCFPCTWQSPGKDEHRRGKRRMYPAALLPEFGRLSREFGVRDGHVASEAFFNAIFSAFSTFQRQLQATD